MMSTQSYSSVCRSVRYLAAIAGIIWMGFFSSPQPALAHHATGGKIPSNFFEGFLSGLAHPLIGLDHFAFVVAVGLLAAQQGGGALLPAGFIVAAMAGTGIHLLGFDLPGAEVAIATSVIVFGAMLVWQNRPNYIVVGSFAAISGLFHGYAYGEAIVGAQMTELFAYLLGFSLIQYAVALIAFQVGNALLKSTNQTLPWFRLAGLAICSIGVVFLTSSMLGYIMSN